MQAFFGLGGHERGCPIHAGLVWVGLFLYREMTLIVSFRTRQSPGPEPLKYLL